ncbi:NlpC/P60 family protein [Actinomadura sp. WMMA1423]|uniref:NlpC/P60 family protein n=1 Tax=Actinomadura sp. WMMA1423 TaxID=2591108 RepID=UPI001146B2C9|nr:NlpC/P60 family protein [Actinomadura sp. WMMA1423]
MDEDSSPWKGSESSPPPLEGGELLGDSPSAPPEQEGPPPSGSTAPQPVAEGALPDDTAVLEPEDVAALESDPRIAAAAQQPQNSADILAAQSAGDRGVDGQGINPYGDAALRGGQVNLTKLNPLTGRGAAANGALGGAAGGAAKAPGKDSESGENRWDGIKQAAGAAAKDAATNAAEEALGQFGLTLPKGDTTGKKVAHGTGQGANFALARAADAYAPGLYDRLMGNRFVRWLGVRSMKNSVAGMAARALAPDHTEAFFEGFQSKYTKDKKQKNRKDTASGSGSSSETERGKLKVLLAVGLPIFAAFLSIVLIAALILGVGMDDDVPESQPEQASDVKVAEYFPGNWQQILKKASEQTSGNAQDYSEVPWTILAGLAKAQTDFARYSPYDNIDRDPGRKSKEVPGGNGSGDGGGVDVNVSNTVGAGPGPVQGVTGPGSAATVPGTENGHVAPPDGDLSHQLGWFLWALRMQESGGHYDRSAGTSKSSACGAYQYITSTWNNYRGYARACDAPPEIQDERAKRDILQKWNKYHKWQPVAVDHFTGSWGPYPEKWDQCPAACDFNPTAWKYVDGVMTKMRAAAQAHPAGSGGVQPASFRAAPGGPSATTAALRADSGTAASPGTYAWGCDVPNPDPKIGGKGSQGSGPYLLSPAAAGQMRLHGLDPQNPCQSSYFVAFELVKAAERVHRDPKSPQWKPDGDEKDQANARKYWSKVIATSGIFVERTANPDGPCAVPTPDDPEKPWSISFKIISIWRCETNRIQDLYLVTGGKYMEGQFKYSVQDNRAAAVETLVNEAMSVSYGAGKWKTEGCDNGKDSRQGIFPMTKKEAEEAGVEDRCDVDKNIAGAAKLVLSVEKVPPEERPHDLGVFQPMIGGWQKLSIAMGTDLELFSLIGPGQNTFEGTDECTAVMRKFLTDIAPYANEFASLKKPPGIDTVYSEWETKLENLEKAHGITDPGSDPKCMIGSWAPGYNATLAQIAAGLTDGANSANLNGLGNYYQGREDANTEMPPVVGEDTLVIPRLALRPLKPVGAPVGEDAAEAWSRLGNTEGVLLPLEQVAVEYAWFFGGVIPPFDSAGKLIGSLATGGGAIENVGTTQTTVGPDGCPIEVGTRALHDGVVNKATNPDQITIHKLCVDSVAKARTPQAAMAIKWALNHLNWPYAPLDSGKRNDPGWADCSSFVSRAYRDSGAIPNLYPKGSNAPVTGTFREVRWMHKIQISQAKPGDLVEPHSGHVAMQLADGYKVHTNRTGDVSKVERAYTSAYWVGWVDASKV